MTDREQRALKIAGYEGWYKVSEVRYLNEKFYSNDSIIDSQSEHIETLIKKYSTSDGLITAISEFKHTETLVDCLQEAIIFYHENKEKGK